MNTFKLFFALFAFMLATAPVAGLADDQTPMQGAGQWIDDVAMATTVRAVIVGDTGLKGFDINVIVHNANVQLSGYVNSQKDIDHAVDLTKSINGVRSVTNNLLIKQ